MTAVVCRDVTVAYGATEVLAGVDFDVAAGETVALLGPSGSGKTTLLYAIAGLVPLAGGEVRVGGSLVSGPAVHVPPDRRSVGLVFQNYALWPHLDARDTVAYPMRRRGVGRSEARNQAVEILERLRIGDLAHRRPSELSGGQQQRVGLARALARDADVYLFDEPTAHLDAALRRSVEEEIDRRRRRSGVAAVYATHDAAEALAVADRLALMRDGRIVQTGPPGDVYERPHDLWAARMTGTAFTLDAHRSGTTAVVGEVEFEVGDVPDAAGRVSLLLRPEWVLLDGPLAGEVRQVRFRGSHTDYRLTSPYGTVEARLPGPPRFEAGDQTGWRPTKVHLLGPAGTGD